MFERILVPLDGSSISETILPHLGRLSRAGKTEVVLVRSENPLAIDVYGAIVDVVLAGAREYLLAVQERVFRGVRSRVIERLGGPLQTILRVADEDQVTLMAMATRGRRGVQRLFLGSVAEQVIRRSPVPVYALHPSWSYELAPPGRIEDLPFRKILLPLYGAGRWGPSAWAAAEWGKRFGAQILLLPLQVPSWNGSGRRRTATVDMETAKRELGEVMAWMSQAGVDSAPLFEEGDPVERILRVCPSRQVDLVVMPTDSQAGASRKTSLGVEERVLRETTVPILAVNFRPGHRGVPAVSLSKGGVAR